MAGPMGEEAKRVLVVGTGLQGKAVIHDLEKSPLVSEVVAADMDVQGARELAERLNLRKVRLVRLDASRQEELDELVRSTGAQIVICMLPPTYGYPVARAALDAGVPFVSSSYTGRIAELGEEAVRKGVTILPEMGMDPGIDLLLGKMAISELDEVHGMHSYGAGLPEPDCADNPVKYKITWTFDGVLKAYKRPARLLRNGEDVGVAGTQVFRPENIHLVDVEGLGPLEAYPNGDAIHYIDIFGLGSSVQTMGRFGMRYPGHCQFWRAMVELGFLDDTPLSVGGASLSPHEFLVRHLTPRLQFRREERDVAVVRVLSWGLKDGKKREVISDLIDYRDLESGLFAMNRTVGYTTSIGAQMILAGAITKAGVLSPVHDVPTREALEALQQRGMSVRHTVRDLEE